MDVRRGWFITVSIVLFLFSCQKDDASVATEPGKNNGENTTGSATVNQVAMLQLVNQVRQTGCNCGSTAMPAVAPVTWNDQLANAALVHSSDMSVNNYFNHTALNGSTAGERITAAGYNWRAYGENIAKGYSSEQAVVAGWLSSEGHCKNIMNPIFKEMGVARVGSYWTQEFGSR